MPRKKTIIKVLLSSIFLNAASYAAEESTLKAPVGAESSTAPYKSTQVLTLKDLGAKKPLNIIGVDGRSALGVSLREDQMVTNATLDLQYSYSTALIPELSSLNVLMNDELVASIPVTKEGAGQTQLTKLDIPAWMFTSYNQLGLQLIGHYTRGCEDPWHSTLWTRVSNRSALNITTQPLKLSNDLGLFPLPFYSHHDNNKLNLPFVFSTMPDAGQLEAAGFVASWFGHLADYRGANFTVNLNQIPERGHAIVFVTPEHTLPIQGMPEILGPGLAIVNNPNDDYGKLLVIYGRNNQDLKLAARALLLGKKAFTGANAEISQLEMPAKREPYDAPLWIRQDRPMKFGELVSARELSPANGFQSIINVPLRLPPDLFLKDSKGIPINLKYRYTPREHDDKSKLNISINDHYITSDPLFSEDQVHTFQNSVIEWVMNEKQVLTESKFYLPEHLLAPHSEVTFHFLFDKPKNGECKSSKIDYLKDHAVVDADSTIDISHIKHYIRMPNLQAFANSGFPFTRMADLSETAVVLPDMADNDTIEAYLQLMAKMGESTGYPAIRVAVLGKSELVKGLDKDLIVLEKAPVNEISEKWQASLPIKFKSNFVELTIVKPLARAWYWLFPDEDNKPEGTIVYSQYSKNGFLAGFESPYKSGRSVVLWAANENVSFKEMIDTMLNPEKELPNVQGSFVTLYDGKANSLTAKTSYTLGSLGLWDGLRFYMSKHPIVGDLLALLVILIASLICTGLLNAKAKRRLAGEAQ